MRVWLLALPILAAVLAVGAGSSHAGRAAYPGRNGLIAFVRGGDLWTIKPDGAGLTRLTKTAEKEFDPAWSPNGTKLAYGDNVGHIWVANADGSSALDLSAIAEKAGATACDSHPTWSPNGKQIAFSAITSDCTGAAGGLYAVAPNGEKRHVIEEDYSGILGGDEEPAWSPGGARIAFTRSDSERMASGPYVYDIWVLDARTGKTLKALTGNSHSTSPSWRPNGKQIAFAGPKGITTMTAAGKSQTVLARGKSPAWSPDSGQIVYVGTDGLYTIRTNGSRARRLLLKCACSAPDWQPLK